MAKEVAEKATMTDILKKLDEQLGEKAQEVRYDKTRKEPVLVEIHKDLPKVQNLDLGHPLVIIESPYHGDVEANVRYALECCKDAISKGENPFASHLYYTQFLDEEIPAQRQMGISFGFAIWELSTKQVFYVDRGLSEGMLVALRRAIEQRKPIEFRYLFGGK